MHVCVLRQTVIVRRVFAEVYLFYEQNRRISIIDI